MPNSITADEVLTRQNKRMFIQFGAARPNNTVFFAGQGSQYMAVNGLTIPELGNITPIWVSDPRRAKQYKLSGRSIAPPDLPKAELVFREKHGAVPRHLLKFQCALSFYEAGGVCGDLSDFLAGWSDYVMIYSNAIVTSKDGGQRTSFDSDEPVETRVAVTLSDAYPIGALGFGEGATTQVDREVVDAVYGNRQSCGNCGESDDGSNRMYAVTKSSGAGSPGLPSEVVYSLDGGATWNQTVITGMGATEDPLAIDIAGKYLIVIGSAAYYYAEINQFTGVPGTWTKVTTGFVASKDPQDLFVLSPSEIYMCGLGGYIYKITNVPSGATVNNAGAATTANLYRIHGSEDVLVAVGASGTVIRSINRGSTWASTTTTPVTLNTIRALAVLDVNRYWVGVDLVGRAYYTLNGGESWVEFSFPGNGSGTVWDIVFPTDEVGYLSHSTTTPTARLFATWNGGFTWTNTTPRVTNWPTFNKAGRIACPIADSTVSANNVLIAGLSAGGTDGIILEGVVSKI